MRLQHNNARHRERAPVILSALHVILSAPHVILSAPHVILSAPPVILSEAKDPFPLLP